MIKIDKIQLQDNVLLAPMSGVTDLPFRRLVKSFGASLVISEMIASRAMIMQTRESLKKCQKDDTHFPMSVQLAGCEPEVMAEAARLNEDLGADIIDINFGCPVKKVVNGFAGSALMKDEDLATRIMDAVVRAVKIPVTMKMRLGWNYENLNAASLAKKAENVGIKMLTVHGRTRCQMYNGSANWELINAVKEMVKIPVIANGDIKTTADAKRALELSKADGVMIGRACYGKPWLINQINQELKGEVADAIPSIEEQQKIVLNHFQEMIEDGLVKVNNIKVVTGKNTVRQGDVIAYRPLERAKSGLEPFEMALEILYRMGMQLDEAMDSGSRYGVEISVVTLPRPVKTNLATMLYDIYAGNVNVLTTDMGATLEDEMPEWEDE
ncbi:tRNA dihydrouridine synthase DusB [bacterium]|nr:tRNA dihydrouridine synthase DusB [bacterium]